MFRILMIVSALLASSCSSCLQQVNKNLDRVRDPGAPTCIPLSAFPANLDRAVQGKVVGYVSGARGLPQAGTWGSWRLSQDGSQPWTVDTPINIVSISKVITTSGVLQLMATHNRQLTDHVASHLPPGWGQGA